MRSGLFAKNVDSEPEASPRSSSEVTVYVDVESSERLQREDALLVGSGLDTIKDHSLCELRSLGKTRALLVCMRRDGYNAPQCLVASSLGLRGTFSLHLVDFELPAAEAVSIALLSPADAASLVWDRYDRLKADKDYQRMLQLRLQSIPLLRGGRQIDITFEGSKVRAHLVPSDREGDRFRIAPKTRLTILPPSIMSPLEVGPVVRSRLLGGLDGPLQELIDFLGATLLRPELFEGTRVKPPRGVLLYGPPGTGKTLLARCFAERLKEVANAQDRPAPRLHVVESASIMASPDPESELKKIFAGAAESAVPSLLFFDEIDALCPKRADSGDIERRIVALMLTELDGAQSQSQLAFLATTNRPDSIDEAMRRTGRIDREIEIGVPSRVARREILTVLLDGLTHDCSECDIDDVAEDAHGFVGADLASVVQTAFLAAVTRDRAVHKSDLIEALKSTVPSAMREVYVEIPRVPWDAIGGYEATKMKLRECVEWPLLHRDLFAKVKLTPPRGVLLYGPPGCSKTLMARAVASESKMNFISVKGPALFSKWVGESEKQVRDLFRRARQNAPCIIFLDEIDAVGGSRDGSSGVESRVLTQILTEMDGMGAASEVVVIGATNRPDVLDAALVRPGRLDRIVYVPLPDSAARKEIFRVHLKELPLAENASEEVLDSLAAASPRLTGAEIAGVVREVVMGAVRKLLAEGEESALPIPVASVIAQVKATRPRISEESENWFDSFFASKS